MSLAVALEGRDGVVLAADSRGTIGDPRGLTAINDQHEKLFRLSDYVGVAISGASEVGRELVRMAQSQIVEAKACDMRMEGVVSNFRKLARMAYDDWFAKIEDIGNRPNTHVVLAGINDDKAPRIVLLPSQLDFAPTAAAAGFMMAGIPQYATYLVHRFYDGGQDVRSLANLAIYLIVETASQDPKVGGPIRVATITVQDGYKALSEDTITEISVRNEEQSGKMREFFYARDDDV